MDTEPVPVPESEANTEELLLRSAPRMVVVTQFLAGVVFLAMALVNLLGSQPSGLERFIGVIASLVSGMAFGVAGTLRYQGRMVRRHLDAWHADEAARTTHHGL